MPVSVEPRAGSGQKSRTKPDETGRGLVPSAARYDGEPAPRRLPALELLPASFFMPPLLIRPQRLAAAAFAGPGGRSQLAGLLVPACCSILCRALLGLPRRPIKAAEGGLL